VRKGCPLKTKSNQTFGLYNIQKLTEDGLNKDLKVKTKINRTPAGKARRQRVAGRGDRWPYQKLETRAEDVALW
jgi:hypothetical protein